MIEETQQCNMTSAVTGYSVEMTRQGENTFRVYFRQHGRLIEWHDNLSASKAHVLFKDYVDIIIERQDDHFEQLKHQL